MPKFRQLHCKIVDSFDFADMPSDFCRCTWMLLPVIMDSEGRGIDSMTWIRSRMYPLREDVTVEQLEEVMVWLNDRGMIKRYEVSGRRYLCIPTWHNYQTGTDREARSMIPAPLKEERKSVTTPELLPTKSGPAPEEVLPLAVAVAVDIDVVNKRPEIFKIYEDEIGALTPLISEKLQEAEKTYPPDWIPRAIREAVGNNVRKWSYVEAILKRWLKDGFATTGKEPTTGKKKKGKAWKDAYDQWVDDDGNPLTIEEVNALYEP